MIISKKKYDNDIREAKAEMEKEFEMRMNRMHEERYQDERIVDINRRMDNAFCDINRRLSALEEKTKPIGDYPVCPRY